MSPGIPGSKAAICAPATAGLLVALCLVAAPAAAQDRCPDVPVDVAGASQEEHDLTCAAARDALQVLARCGISLRRPLSIHIMREVRHPFSGPIFGLFDVGRERVLVTQYANIAALIEHTPYRELPPTEFYASLIVHEVVHGVLHQNYGRRPKTHAAYEYPAYALQIEHLSARARERFLQSSAREPDAREGFLFTDAILLFDPFFFAARAYQHFKSSTDGCAHIHSILEGAADFITAPP
jgi:hypothetical protein